MNEQPPRVVVAGMRPSALPTQLFDGQIDLAVARTDEELRALVREANVLYSWRIPESVPTETPDLRWIHLPSAGIDHVRALPVWQSDIILTASQGIHMVPMAEHLFALMLALTRQVATMVRAQERREWLHDTQRPHFHLTELRGRTLGIIGWGKIGETVAHLARAFGMRVVGTRWSIIVPREVPHESETAYTDPPWLEPVDAPADIVYPAVQLHEVLAQSDFVVLILPLTEETRGSFAETEFGSMKRGSLFFNIGRGPVVDEAALIHALRSGRLAGAGLDVFAHEPLPPASPLWSMENVIISPHLGGMSDRTAERGIRLFAVNLSRYLAGQPLLNVVNRERGY
jgi:phosphoglycerate dehydrogenase-like enzyme